MGLFRIQLKRGAEERIPATMMLLGLPVARVEERDNGTHYFFTDPKSKREYSFWTHAEDTKLFWLSGLSSSAKKIAQGFSASGLFVDETAA